MELFAPPDDVKAVERPARARDQVTRRAWLRSAMANGHWEPWQRPWRHRRPWTARPSADERAIALGVLIAIYFSIFFGVSMSTIYRDICLASAT